MVLSRSLRFLVWFLLSALPVAGPVAAQLPPASPQTPPPADPAAPAILVGRVVKAGESLSGVPVTLHRVSSQESGEVETQTTDPSGTFRFDLPPGDPTGFTVYFVTAEHLSIRHFGAPVHRGEVPAGYQVELYDTTSVAAGVVTIARRDVILLPQTDGSWAVNELVRLVNTGRKTLVSASGAPTWEFVLPEGATDLEASEGEVPTADLRLMGDRVLFVGSLLPGARELIVRYRFPADVAAVNLEAFAATDTFEVYIPEAAASATVRGLTTTRVITADEQRFVRYSGVDLQAGHPVTVAWKAVGPPVDPVVAALVVTLALLAAGTWAGVRRRDGRVAPTPGRGRGPRPTPAAPASRSS